MEELTAILDNDISSAFSEKDVRQPAAESDFCRRAGGKITGQIFLELVVFHASEPLILRSAALIYPTPDDGCAAAKESVIDGQILFCVPTGIHAEFFEIWWACNMKFTVAASAIITSKQNISPQALNAITGYDYRLEGYSWNIDWGEVQRTGCFQINIPYCLIVWTTSSNYTFIWNNLVDKPQF